MYEASDTMEDPPTFSKGDIVWVKLSSYWWPGEVISEEDLPGDLLSDFKKPPLVIVKFFDEDSYSEAKIKNILYCMYNTRQTHTINFPITSLSALAQGKLELPECQRMVSNQQLIFVHNEYVRNWSNIYPYNSSKKSEFIRKGMAGFRAKLSHMAKFPKDIGTAEERTDGNPNILSQPEFLPVKKVNYDEIFGTPSPKKSAKGKVSLPSSKKTPARDNQPHITHRRFLGNDDYRAYICVQYPGKDRQWDSDDEEIKKLNEEPEKILTCHSCSFKTKRLEVMILHTKMHIQGIYITAKRKTKKPKGEGASDSESDTAVTKSPKPKQRKKKEASSKTTDVFSNLLEEWNDTDEEMEEEEVADKKPKKVKKTFVEVEKPSSDGEKEENLNDRGDKGNTSTTEKVSNIAGNKEVLKPQSFVKNTQDDIKNCFDFDEEEEDDDILLPTSVGRKIPRVIPEKPKPRISELLEQSQKEDDLAEEKSSDSVGETEKQPSSTIVTENGADVTRNEISRINQNVNKTPAVDENIENAFKELMTETELPALDALAQSLKPEQNFHDARTVKFPDKGGTSLKGGTTSKGGGTSKKKFVTSFEDFEAGFRKLNEKERAKKEESDKEDKTSKIDDDKDQTTAEPAIAPKDCKENKPEPMDVPSEEIKLTDTNINTEEQTKRPAKDTETIEHSTEPSTDVSSAPLVEQKNISQSSTPHNLSRRRTRQSDKERAIEAALEQDADVKENKKNISQEATLHSRPTSRRRTKQFVIEENSEEIIEITTECDIVNVINSSEQIVHLDENSKENLAKIDLEIEILKRSLETTESILEDVDQTVKVGQHSKNEGLESSKVEESSENSNLSKEVGKPAGEEPKGTEARPKSQRTTRHSLITEHLQAVEKKMKQLKKLSVPSSQAPDKETRSLEITESIVEGVDQTENVDKSSMSEGLEVPKEECSENSNLSKEVVKPAAEEPKSTEVRPKSQRTTRHSLSTEHLQTVDRKMKQLKKLSMPSAQAPDKVARSLEITEGLVEDVNQTEEVDKSSMEEGLESPKEKESSENSNLSKEVVKPEVEEPKSTEPRSKSQRTTRHSWSNEHLQTIDKKMKQLKKLSVSSAQSPDKATRSLEISETIIEDVNQTDKFDKCSANEALELPKEEESSENSNLSREVVKMAAEEPKNTEARHKSQRMTRHSLSTEHLQTEDKKMKQLKKLSVPSKQAPDKVTRRLEIAESIVEDVDQTEKVHKSSVNEGLESPKEEESSENSNLSKEVVKSAQEEPQNTEARHKSQRMTRHSLSTEHLQTVDKKIKPLKKLSLSSEQAPDKVTRSLEITESIVEDVDQTEKVDKPSVNEGLESPKEEESSDNSNLSKEVVKPAVEEPKSTEARPKSQRTTRHSLSTEHLQTVDKKMKPLKKLSLSSEQAPDKVTRSLEITESIVEDVDQTEQVDKPSVNEGLESPKEEESSEISNLSKEVVKSADEEPKSTEARPKSQRTTRHSLSTEHLQTVDKKMKPLKKLSLSSEQAPDKVTRSLEITESIVEDVDQAEKVDKSSMNEGLEGPKEKESSENFNLSKEVVKPAVEEPKSTEARPKSQRTTRHSLSNEHLHTVDNKIELLKKLSMPSEQAPDKVTRNQEASGNILEDVDQTEKVDKSSMNEGPKEEGSSENSNLTKNVVKPAVEEPKSTGVPSKSQRATRHSLIYKHLDTVDKKMKQLKKPSVPCEQAPDKIVRKSSQRKHSIEEPQQCGLIEEPSVDFSIAATQLMEKCDSVPIESTNKGRRSRVRIHQTDVEVELKKTDETEASPAKKSEVSLPNIPEFGPDLKLDESKQTIKAETHLQEVPANIIEFKNDQNVENQPALETKNVAESTKQETLDQLEEKNEALQETIASAPHSKRDKARKHATEEQTDKTVPEAEASTVIKSSSLQPTASTEITSLESVIQVAERDKTGKHAKEEKLDKAIPEINSPKDIKSKLPQSSVSAEITTQESMTMLTEIQAVEPECTRPSSVSEKPEPPTLRARRGRSHKSSKEEEKPTTVKASVDSLPEIGSHEKVLISNPETDSVERSTDPDGQLHEEPTPKTRRARTRKISRNEEQHSTDLEKNSSENLAIEPAASTLLRISIPESIPKLCKEFPVETRMSRSRSDTKEKEQSQTILQEARSPTISSDEATNLVLGVLEDSSKSSNMDVEQITTDDKDSFNENLILKPSADVMDLKDNNLVDEGQNKESIPTKSDLEIRVTKTRKGRTEKHGKEVSSTVKDDIQKDLPITKKATETKEVTPISMPSDSVLEPIDCLTMESKKYPQTSIDTSEFALQPIDRLTMESKKSPQPSIEPSDFVLQSTESEKSLSQPSIEQLKKSSSKTRIKYRKFIEKETNIATRTQEATDYSTSKVDEKKAIDNSTTETELQVDTTQIVEATVFSISSEPKFKARKGRSKKHKDDKIREPEPTEVNTNLLESQGQSVKSQTVVSDSVDKIIDHSTPRSRKSRGRKYSKGDEQFSSQEQKLSETRQTKEATEHNELLEHGRLDSLALPEEHYSKTRRGRSRRLTKEEEDLARAIEESLKDIARERSLVEGVVGQLSETNKSITDPVSLVPKSDDSLHRSKKRKTRINSKSKELVSTVTSQMSSIDASSERIHFDSARPEQVEHLKDSGSIVSESVCSDSTSHISATKRRKSRTHKNDDAVMEKNESRCDSYKTVQVNIASNAPTAHIAEMESSTLKSSDETLHKMLEQPTPNTTSDKTRKQILEEPQTSNVVEIGEQLTSKSKRGRQRKHPQQEVQVSSLEETFTASNDKQGTAVEETCKTANDKQDKELTAALEFTKTVLELVESQHPFSDVSKIEEATAELIIQKDDVSLEISSQESHVSKEPVIEYTNKTGITSVTEDISKSIIPSLETTIEDVVISQVVDYSVNQCTGLNSTVPSFTIPESNSPKATNTESLTRSAEYDPSIPVIEGSNPSLPREEQKPIDLLLVPKVLEQSVENHSARLEPEIPDSNELNDGSALKTKKIRPRKNTVAENAVEESNTQNLEPELKLATANAAPQEKTEPTLVSESTYQKHTKDETSWFYNEAPGAALGSMGSIIYKAIDQSVSTLDSIPKSGLSEWVGGLLELATSREGKPGINKKEKNSIEDIKNQYHGVSKSVCSEIDQPVDVTKGKQPEVDVASVDKIHVTKYKRRRSKEDTPVSETSQFNVADVQASGISAESQLENTLEINNIDQVGNSGSIQAETITDNKNLETDISAKTGSIKKHEMSTQKNKRGGQRKSSSNESPLIRENSGKQEEGQDKSVKKTQDSQSEITNIRASGQEKKIHDQISSEVTEEALEPSLPHTRLSTSEKPVIIYHKSSVESNDDVNLSVTKDNVPKAQEPVQSCINNEAVLKLVSDVELTTFESPQGHVSREITFSDEHEEIVQDFVVTADKIAGGIKTKSKKRKSSLSLQDEEDIQEGVNDIAPPVYNEPKVKKPKGHMGRSRKRSQDTDSMNKSRQEFEFGQEDLEVDELVQEIVKKVIENEFEDNGTTAQTTETKQEECFIDTTSVQTLNVAEHTPKITSDVNSTDLDPADMSSAEQPENTDKRSRHKKYSSDRGIITEQNQNLQDNTGQNSDLYLHNIETYEAVESMIEHQDKTGTSSHSKQRIPLLDASTKTQSLPVVSAETSFSISKEQPKVYPVRQETKVHEKNTELLGGIKLINESKVTGDQLLLETTPDEVGISDNRTDEKKVSSELNKRHVPPKKNRWSRRGSYAKKDDDDSHSYDLLKEPIVHNVPEIVSSNEVILEKKVVEIDNEAMIETSIVENESECQRDLNVDKKLFKNADLIERNLPENVSGIVENAFVDLNDSEIILPPKKSKRANEVKFTFLNDSFSCDTLSSEKKADNDILSFPSCDDSIMSTSLRNNIEGLIKDIDNFDNSYVSESVNKIPEGDGTKIATADVLKTEEMKSEANVFSLTDSRECTKEPVDILKCVPPKKKKIDFSEQDVTSSSVNILLQNDTLKTEGKLTDVILQPPKKKMQKLFESSQALEKPGKANDLPQMSPLAKKKSFLFHPEEFVCTQNSTEISQQADVAAIKTPKENVLLDEITSESVSLDSTNLKTEELATSSLESNVVKTDVNKSATLPKKRIKRKSSSHSDHLHKKERRKSIETYDTNDGQDQKVINFGNDAIVPQPQYEEQIGDTTTSDASTSSTSIEDNSKITDEHTNEMEVKLEDGDFKFRIQTNLSNLAISTAEELSAIATAALSEIKQEITMENSQVVSETPNENKQAPTVVKEYVEPIVKQEEPLKHILREGVEVSSESEFVPISINPTVMSEKDLADAQVEITTDKIISEKKPTSLRMFSMDFLESTLPRRTTIRIKKKEMASPKVNNTSGTEFTSKAMTKEFDNRPLIAQPKAYALKSELLDILEGNSNSSTNSSGSEQKFKTSFDNYDKQNVVQGMFDFEEAIPSQIVLSNKVDPETVLMDSPKLLERLSLSSEAAKATPKKVLIQSDFKVSESIPKGLITKITKPIGTPKPGQKIIIRTTKAQAALMPKAPGSKPIILSEQIIRPANIVKAVKPTSQPQGIKRQYEDIEDVEAAFIIPKIAKKSVEEDVPVSPDKLPRARNSKSGKAKILQQTIITSKGEIIQPKTPTASIPSDPIQLVQAQSDDTVFDINSMPIVLSDDLLTPESIQNMPVVLSEDMIPHSKPVSVKAEEKASPILAKKLVSNVIPKQQIIFKTTSPAVTAPSQAKQTTKPRVLSTTPPVRVPKPGTTALLATGTSVDGKPTKYVLVPSTASQVKAIKPPVVKKTPPVQSKPSVQPSDPPSQIVGNKIMIVTNQHGQQTRVVLTPEQQKVFMQAQPGSKTKVIKGAIPKALLESAAAGPSGVVQKTAPPIISQVTMPTVSSQGGGLLMTVGKGIKTPVPSKKSTKSSKPQKTILIKNQMGQTVRKIQGTDDDDLDRQVAEQLEAIKASARLQQANKSPEIINYTNRNISSTISSSNRTAIRRPYKRVEPVKGKPVVAISQTQPQKSPDGVMPALAPLSPQSRIPQIQNQLSPNLPIQTPPLKADQSTLISKPGDTVLQQPVPVSTKLETKIAVAPTTTGTPPVETEQKPVDRPLTQLVIQDGLGNQTTITEGQILAIPSETVDGQPQSYMLVTLDEMGNITPLNNEALMSLDPSLGLGGDLNNVVLQVDQGQGMVAALKPAEPSVPVSNVEQIKAEERLPPQHSKISKPVPELKPAPVEQPKPQEAPLAVEQQIVIGEGVLPGADAGGQQLIVTGDPIATQKFLESLSDGSTDLANILANAEGGSVLIQADGQQILIKTNTGGQTPLDMAENTEGGGNPIFGTHKPNQDILAAALANTDVFQQSDQPVVHQSPVKGSQLSPGSGGGVLYPMHVGNVLETSLTLHSPIMTPLEVPSMPSKKIDDDVDILTQVPKNLDLPITITDPNISQTVAQQQTIGLMELTLPISETSSSAEINSPSYTYSLAALDESVSHAQKPFSGSMPLLTEDVTEMESSDSSHMGKIRVAKGLHSETGFSSNFGSLPLLPETIESSREEVVKTSCFGEMESLPMLTEDVIEDSGSSIGSSKTPRSSSKSMERDIVDEGLSTLGGEMCSSLSEPPPDMFDLASMTAKEEEVSSDISSIPEPEGETLSLHSENSGEIPLQPPIVANLNDLKRPGEDTQEQDEKRPKFD